MDNRAFMVVLNTFFEAILFEYGLYCHNVFHSDQVALLRMLNREFWATSTGGQPSDTVSIYERTQNALKTVLWYNCYYEVLDMEAVKQALPRWPELFACAFNDEICGQLSFHAREFDIWMFLTPTMTLITFLDLVNKHIDAFKHLHDLENVVLNQEQIVLRPGGRAAEQPTKGIISDANFYHRCMFCTHLDLCSRSDKPGDHMQRKHNYFSSDTIRDGRAYDFGYQKRRDPGVLKTLILKERAIWNSQAMRFHEATKAAADLSGNSYDRNPHILDVQGRDLEGIRKEVLATKLCSLRAQLMVGDYCETTVRQAIADAWRAGRQRCASLRDFTWGN